MTESSITALRQGLVWSAADEVLRNAVPEEEYLNCSLPDICEIVPNDMKGETD